MRIEVEPQALINAGKGVGSLGTQLGALSDAMGHMLSSGIASGADPAGLNFGISYGRQADQFGQHLAQAANAFKNVGRMLEATGYNYQHADQASAAGGAGPSGSVSGEPGKTTPADAPYGPNGSLVTPPAKYHLIAPFLQMIPAFGMAAGVAMTWPSGNSAMMNVTAAQWRNFGAGLKVFESALESAKAAVGAQSIPEGATIATALSELGGGTTTLAGIADGLATSVSDFAAGVLETQEAIRNLLNRISLEGLWDTVTGLLSGDGDRVLREIADDVSTVLQNFQNQVKGVLGLLDELKTLLGEASDAFAKWLRPILVETFGEEHGNFLASAIDLYTDVQVGGAAAVIGLVSGTVALADPDTWKGLADTAIMIAKDPTKIDDVLKQAGSEFIALDEWQGANPGRGFGEAAGNIASLFIPGGALSKGGSVAKGLAFTRNLFEKGELGRLGRLPELGGHRTPDLPDLPDAPGTPHIPEFTPTPDAPGSTPPPHGPSSSTPSSPTSPGSGTGHGSAPTEPSPNGSGPTQHGGGAAPGDSSSRGPAPTGGSPSTGGGDGPSKPSGGAPVSPSMTSPSGAPGSSGPIESAAEPRPAGGGDVPGSQSSGGVGSNPGGGSSGVGDGPGHPSRDGTGAGTASESKDQGSVDAIETDSNGSLAHPAESGSGSDTGEHGAGHRDDTESGGEAHGHLTDDADGTRSESDDTQWSDHSDTGGVPLTREQIDEIVATDKGHRPPPESYLPPDYIAEHLEKFHEGASRILIRSDFEEYGVGKPDAGKSEFVLTKDDAEAIMAECGGDPIKIAQKLGIPEDQLAGDSLVRIDFHPSGSYDPLMPSGNEWGANKQWIPGGRLPEGDLEAVVLTDGMIKGRDYTVRDLLTGEIL